MTRTPAYRTRRRRKDFDPDRGGQPARLWTLAFETPMDQAAGLLALRIIEGERLQARLVDGGDIRDVDIPPLLGLGLDNPHDTLSAAQLGEWTRTRLAELAARRGRRLHPLDGNVDRLGDLLGLSPCERDLLRMAAIASHSRCFGSLFDACAPNPSQAVGWLAQALGRPAAAIARALGPSSTLVRSGLIACGGFSHRGQPLELDAQQLQLLLMPRLDGQRMLARLVRPSLPATLALADFAHVAECGLMRRYLQRAFRPRRRGTNLLLHGAPGTGKTEFVRSLAADLALTLHEVPTEDEDGAAVSGNRRFRSYALSQDLLAPRPRHLLLFDEVEDVFGAIDQPSGGLWFGGRRDPDSVAKGWVNHTLESNPVPTVWVCNSIRAIDPAFLRRFDMVVEFRQPVRSVRRRVLAHHFGNDLLAPAAMDRLANLEPLPPGLVGRAAKVVRVLGSRQPERREAEARSVLEGSLRALGHRPQAAVAALPSHYDPGVLNTDRDLGALVAGLRAGRPARLCLYGPPGTGKSALGHHLARVLDRPLLLRRGSDLLSMWVGGTEANLARAFEQARDEGAVLLIDEADGFLQDRSQANATWEVTGVNELLTQMEAFSGVFVASTNLVERLDPAALRRFDFKIRFGFLDRGQRRRLVSGVLSSSLGAGSGAAALDVAALRRLDGMDRLTPGDVANALRQLAVTGEAVTASGLLELLEGELRMKPGAGAPGIGFLA
jgi:AAA+ superfamily predicted ATPase